MARTAVEARKMAAKEKNFSKEKKNKFNRNERIKGSQVNGTHKHK